MKNPDDKSPSGNTKNPETIKRETSTKYAARIASMGNRYLVDRQMPPKFNFNKIFESFQNPSSGIIFHKLLNLFSDVPFKNDDSTWHGVTNTLLDPQTLKETVEGVVIGTQKLPREFEEVFGWGVEDKDHEYAVKAAHEIAHVYQKLVGFEEDLIRSKKDGANFKPTRGLGEASYAYIYLYDMLSIVKQSTGKAATGLASLPVYHTQTETKVRKVVEWGHTPESALDQVILEDITELMGAYSLGKDYFDFRLNNMNIDEGKRSTVKDIIAKMLPE